jgi:hypothetical protein
MSEQSKTRPTNVRRFHSRVLSRMQQANPVGLVHRHQVAQKNSRWTQGRRRLHIFRAIRFTNNVCSETLCSVLKSFWTREDGTRYWALLARVGLDSERDAKWCPKGPYGSGTEEEVKLSYDAIVNSINSLKQETMVLNTTNRRPGPAVRPQICKRACTTTWVVDDEESSIFRLFA